MMNIFKIIKILRLKAKFRNSLKIDFKIGIRKRLNININGGYIDIGKGVFFNNNCSINSHEFIKIDCDTIIGENVCMYDHNHRYKDKSKLIKEQGYSKGKIIIGKNCWIGSNVIILKGVTIGDNVVIGANTIIHKSIPSNSIVKNNSNIIIESY